MSMKTLLNVLTIFSLGTLTGCDYIEKASLIDDLAKQQELQKSKIEELENNKNNIKIKQNCLKNNKIISQTAPEYLPAL